MCPWLHAVLFFMAQGVGRKTEAVGRAGAAAEGEHPAAAQTASAGRD